MTPRSTQLTGTSRWVLLFLAALITTWATILPSVTASGATTTTAENRVRASTQEFAVAVAVPERITAGQQLQKAPDEPGFVVATGVAANGESGLIRSRIAMRNERGSAGLPGERGHRPSGGAADFDLDELAQLAHLHAGVDDPTRPGLSEIRRVLDRGVPTPLEGQNSVRLDYRGVRVIINEDMPWRSTAYYPGGLGR